MGGGGGGGFVGGGGGTAKIEDIQNRSDYVVPVLECCFCCIFFLFVCLFVFLFVFVLSVCQPHGMVVVKPDCLETENS